MLHCCHLSGSLPRIAERLFQEFGEPQLSRPVA
jgi:hypothetical protein